MGGTWDSSVFWKELWHFHPDYWADDIDLGEERLSAPFVTLVLEWPPWKPEILHIRIISTQAGLLPKAETRELNAYFTFVVFGLVWEKRLKYNACAYINTIKLVQTAGKSLINSSNGLQTALRGYHRKTRFPNLVSVLCMICIHPHKKEGMWDRAGRKSRIDAPVIPCMPLLPHQPQREQAANEPHPRPPVCRAPLPNQTDAKWAVGMGGCAQHKIIVP